MYKHILVAIDGSELNTRAMLHAVGLARALAAQLSAVWVAEPYAPQILAGTPYPFVPVMSSTEFEEQCQSIADRLFAEFRRVAADNGVTTVQTIRESALHPYEGILATVKTVGADLLVMASHGRRGFSALVLGSETHKVLTHSTVPVLVVR